MKSCRIKYNLDILPPLPGVYKFFDASQQLIYVGKAKDLKKRVSSYFIKTQTNQKTRILVQNIRQLDFIIVDTEHDAFLLENSLIKNFRPRYNISLKDDKGYPYIVIKKEAFPCVFLTHNIETDGSEYFGPYPEVGKTRELLEILRILFPLRKSNMDLFLRITKQGNLKVSPENYMKDGRGKEEIIMTKADYSEGLQQVRRILKGDITPVVTKFQNKLKLYVRDKEFEKAAVLQTKLEILKKYQARNTVVNLKIGDVDVFSIVLRKSKAYIQFLQVRKNAIIQNGSIVFAAGIGQDEQEILVSAIIKLREPLKSQAREVIVPFAIAYPDPKIKITVPQKGRKKKLLDLSFKNLMYLSDAKHVQFIPSIG